MKKILLIEDELLLQKSLKKLLERKGAQVIETSSGKEAINKIETNNFDRIICDLMLQDISGFDVIEESKKKYSLNEISQLFIIITAYSSRQVLEKAKAYGCLVIGKPFDDINATLELFLK
ncbi:MAG: response regulator [Bacteriovoracaceae bacterium]|nr:response regulator [Bacteriovoracaceae bacterium]